MSTENISLMRASSDYDGWDPSSIFSNGNSGNISDDSMNDKDDDEVVDKGRKSDSSAGHVRKHSLHHIDRSDNAAESRRTSKRGDQIDADRKSSASAYVMSSGDDHDHPENQEEVIEVTEEDEEIKEEEETEEKDEHETTISKLLPDEETQRDELDEQQILNDEAFNNQDFITSEKNLLDKSEEGNQSEITQHPNLESVNLAQLHERSIDDIGRDAQQERKKIMSHGKLLKMNERRGSQKRDLVATLDKQTIDCEEGRVQMSNINGEKREGVDGEMQGARKLSHKMMEGNKELLKSQVEIETSNVKNEEYSKPSQFKIAQNNGREKAREQRKDQEDKQQKVILAAAATTTTAVVVVAVAAVAARQLSVDKEAKLMMQREIEKVQEAQEKDKRDEESLRKGEEEKREREREAREEEEEEERLRIEEEAKREREREREECEEKEAKIEREAREEEEESLRIEEEAKRERVREREAREEEEKEESLRIEEEAKIEREREAREEEEKEESLRIEEEAKREREREEREEKECTLLQVTGETFREEERRNVEQIEEITVGEEEVRGLIIEEEDSDCNETELREQPIVDLEFERNRQEVLLAAAATTTTAVVLVAVASISAKQLAAGMLGMGEEILSREEVEEIMELAGEPLKSKMMMTDIEEKMSYEDRDTEILGEGDNHYGERREIEEQSEGEGEGEGEIMEEVEEADLEERDVLEDSLQESVIEAGSEHDKGRMEIETADGLQSGHVASFSDSLNIGVDSLNCTAISSRKVAEMGRKVEVGEDMDVDEEGEQEEVEEEGDDENIDELEISELDSPGVKKITQLKNVRPQSSSINEKESAARTVQRVYRGVQGRQLAGKTLLLVERERLRVKHVTQQQKQKTNQKIYDEKKIEFLQQSPINCINENSSVSEEIEDERVLGDGKDSITIHGSQRKASSSFIPLPSPSRTSNKSSISALSSPAKGNDTTLNTTVSNIPIFARNRSSREELLKQRKESSADRKRSSALIYSGQNGSVAAAESGEIEIEDGEDGQDEVGARSKDENGMSRDSADGEEEDSVDDDTVNDSMNTTGSHIPASGSHIPATSSHIPATGSHIPSTGSIHSITKDTKKADYTDFEIVNNEEEEEEEEEVEEEEEHDALSDSLLPLKGLQSHIDDFGELIDGLHTEIETADSHDVEDAIGEHTHSVAAHSGEIDYDLLADSLTLPQSNRGGVDYSKQSSSPMNKINSNITAANLRGNSTNIIPSDSSADRVATEHLVSKVSLKNQSNLQQPKKRLDRGQIMSGGVVDVADMLRNFNSNNGISNDGGKNDKKSSMYGNGSTKDGHAGYSDFQYTDIYGAKSGNADLVQYPINEIHIASVSQKSQEAGMQNKIHHDSPSTSIPPSVRDLLSLTPLPGSVRNSQNNNGAYNGKNNKKKNNNENELRDEVTAHEVVKEEQQGREMMGRNVEVVRRRQLESEVDADRGGRGGEEGEEELEEIETSQYLVQQERYNSERRKRKEEQKGKSTFKDKSKNGLIAIESRILKKFEKKIENKISDGRKRLEKIKINNISKVVNKDKVSEGEEGKNAEERDIVKKEISPKNRKLSRSSREQEEEEEALMEELLELEKRQKKSIKELQKITETDHDSISKNKSRSNRSNCYDDSNSLSQSDKEGSTNPYRGTPGRSGNSSRPAAEREKQNKLAFGPGARDVRKVADYRAFADHAAVARVSASHNTRAGAGNLGKERDKERSPIQVYVSRDSNARNERRQRRILRERGSEIDDEEDNVEEDNDDDMQGQQKSHRSTDSNSRRHENGRLRGSDSEKDRETERDKDIESERGRLNRAGLRGIPESRQLLAPLSSHIDGDGDTGGGGEGYLSEYQRKNVKIRVKNLNRRHSEMVPDYHSDDESQQNIIFKSALSKGREGGIEEDKVFLPALRPPPAVYQISQQHPLDSNRHSQREREKEKKGRLIKASSAPSRLVQGGTPVNDSAAFESESVSTLPPPVRVSHDYGSSNANLLRPLQHGLGTGFGSGRKVR